MKIHTLGEVVDNLKLDEVAIFVSEDVEQDQKALDKYTGGGFNLANMLFFDENKRLVGETREPITLLSSEGSNVKSDKFIILKRDEVDFDF